MNEIHYRKPLYDPFEVFNPSQAFIKEKIKELKQHAYEIRPDRQPLRHDKDFEWLLLPILEQQHEVLCKSIRHYEWRLRNGWGPAAAAGTDPTRGQITETHILQAKQHPLQDYYTGKLRTSGRTLSGRCPFHEEKTASFVIYTDTNKWHCFGACGIGGDVIDYVCKINNLKFIEAVKFILHK